MKTIIRTAVPLWHVVFLLGLAQTSLSPLSAQMDNPEADDPAPSSFEINTVLYQGPLVHDQQWVMKQGTTNNNLLGLFGGTRALITSDVRNIKGFEQVRFKAEHQGFGIWKVTHTDTVVGTAVADTGQQYRYTYNLRLSVTGITTDGKPPKPNLAMPTPTNPGFLDPVPNNVESAALEFDDTFLLLDKTTKRIVADAKVLAWFHRRIDPSEQPPAIMPFVLDGYIATTVETVAGQAGCDPL
jgi:hypothetical protein